MKDDTENPVTDEAIDLVKEETEKSESSEPEKSEEGQKKADAAPGSKITEKIGNEKLSEV